MLPVCFLTLSLLCSADAAEIKSLVEQLSAVEQTERDLTAKQLREVFESSPRKTWEPLLETLKPGLTKKELLTKLQPEQREVGRGIGTGGSHMEEYRLDYSWQLRCWFLNEGNVLREATLESRMQHIWVAPAADFTGTWVTYFVNGQPSHVIEYRDGKYHGKFTSNHADGSKSYVQHYGPDGADGEDTGYFPSGKVSYRAHYSKGKAVGVWTWYNEQGEVTSTRVH
jgi:hypothetical protein